MKPVTIDLAPSGSFIINVGHDLYIPATQAGLLYLRDLLQARHIGLKKVAMPGAPTQAQVDEFFKKQGKKEREDLGIDPVDLEELGL